MRLISKNERSRVLHNASSRKRGVTLIELLVAVGVTALLVSLMLGIVVNITNGWNRSSGSLESGNQARLVLDQITSDLQSAILKRDTNVWMVATVQTSNPGGWTGGGQNTFSIPSGAQPKLEDYRFGSHGVWFRFFSTVPGTNVANDLTTLSAPRAVAYQIMRLPVVAGSSEIKYQMFRSEVLPNLTFTTGYNLLAPEYNTTGSSANNAPLSIRAPDRTNVIANNVVDFGVRIYEGSTLKFPVGSSPQPYAATTSPQPGYVTGFPDSVEVFVRILSAEGAQQLSLLENPPDGYTPPEPLTPAKWWEIVNANSRVYTRRVDLKAKSL